VIFTVLLVMRRQWKIYYHEVRRSEGSNLRYITEKTIHIYRIRVSTTAGEY